MWIYIGLIVVSVIWGINFGVSRVVMDTFGPELSTFLRFSLAVPLFFLVLKVKEKSIGIDRGDIWKLMLIGFIGVTVLEIAVMYSIKYTTLANSSLLNVAPWPIFAALFTPLFMKEVITRRLLLGGLLAMIGVVLIIAGGEESLDFKSEHMLGNLLGLGVSIIGALTNLACMPLMKKYSPLRVSSWYILFGVIFLIPFTLSSWGKVMWGQITMPTVAAILYNVLLCTFLAFIVWNLCMLKAGATRANFFRYVVPAAALLTGFFMYDEKIIASQIFGGILITAGLVWISMEKTRPAAKPVEQPGAA
ncbi:MAG: protein of unknown function transrane [Paenibacillus sp.]|jgi:drug/metabolite transporter (DMT)-like permease|nr:protein of unknown function transrane [Paenibacillus sp.]